MRSILALSSRAGVRAALSFVLAAGAGAAHASVVWQLNDFTFSDGATASGWFDWDEASNKATSWHIETTGGTLPAYTYSDGSSSMYVVGGQPSITFYVGTRQLRMGFADLAALDTPSSHLGLVTTIAGQVGPNGYLECYNCSPYRLGQAGAYLSAPVNDVPEPSTGALALLALAGLAIARRRI